MIAGHKILADPTEYDLAETERALVPQKQYFTFLTKCMLQTVFTGSMCRWLFLEPALLDISPGLYGPPLP